MNNKLLYRAQPGFGVELAFCSIQCADQWYVSTQSNLSEVPFVLEPVKVRWTHAMCGWCGQVAAIPIHCWLCQEDDCPEWDAYAAYTVQAAVRAMMALTGLKELPPGAYKHLEDAAGGMRLTGVPLSTKRLVRQVMHLKAEWMRS